MISSFKNCWYTIHRVQVVKPIAALLQRTVRAMPFCTPSTVRIAGDDPSRNGKNAADDARNGCSTLTKWYSDRNDDNMNVFRKVVICCDSQWYSYQRNITCVAPHFFSAIATYGAMVQVGSPQTPTSPGMALKFDCLFFVEYFAMDLIMSRIPRDSETDFCRWKLRVKTKGTVSKWSKCWSFLRLEKCAKSH